MGREKATLPVGKGTLLEWLVRALGPSFAETIVCGAAAPSDARAVPDRRPGVGPLAGIEAGLAAMATERAFVLACDMPRASARLAGLLLGRGRGHDIALPHVAGRDQPLCAAYQRSALPKISAFLDKGERRVNALVASLDAVRVGTDELVRGGVRARELDDIDTPAEYESFLASLHR